MRRLYQWLLAYKGFVLAAILTGTVIWFYLQGEHARSAKSTEPATGPLRFVSLAWQDATVKAVKAITAEWNANHPETPVEFIQGTWSGIHDYLITGFETGDVPDIFHYESAVVVDFALRGYLADLAPFITQEMLDDILPVDWASVTRSSGEVVGIPFLTASAIVLYNEDLFNKAGIETPTYANPWSWDDLKAAAKKLTFDRNGDGITDQWGAAMGLRNCASLIVDHSIAFGGAYFYNDSAIGKIVTRVGPGEKQLLQNILTMIYDDRTMVQASIGKSSTEMIPGFIAGDYAMIVGVGSWARQQVVENAPSNFHWSVLPPIKAKTQLIGLNNQTLSIPKICPRKVAAMEFIKFFTNTTNMTSVALGDWMMPTRKSSLSDPRFHTAGNGWEVVSGSANFLSSGPWVGLPGFIEWKSRVANPIFQELFANRISLDEAADRIEEESNSVLARYQIRGLKW